MVADVVFGEVGTGERLEQDIGKEFVTCFGFWGTGTNDEAFFGTGAGNIEEAQILGGLFSMDLVENVLMYYVFAFELGESLTVAEVGCDGW